MSGSLFDEAPVQRDPEAGDKLRDAAIARAEENADEGWVEEALLRLERLAHQLDELTADDLWLTQLRQPREPRALGSVFRTAKDRGWIEPSDRFRNSQLPQCHRRPQRVWRSLLRS